MVCACLLPLSLSLLSAASAEDAARRAERAGDYAAEQTACQEIVAAPAASAARVRCARRLAWLAPRQDPDGTFRALTALEAFRRAAQALPPEDARTQAAALARDPQAAPQVREEAALWLAREALRREQADEALAWTTPLWSTTSPSSSSSEVADLHARALLLSGDVAGAQAVEAAADPLRSLRAREGFPLKLLEHRRDRLHRLSWGLLGGYLLLAVPLAAAGWWQVRAAAPRPVGLLALALIGASFAALSALREPGSLTTFLALIGAMGVLHLLSAGALLWTRGRTPAWRWGLRLGAALASAAVGYLTLHASGQLEVVGL